MTIISMSLPDDLLQEIDQLQTALGFTGRSEIIRAGLRSLLTEHKTQAHLKGKVEGVLLVTHKDQHSKEVSALRHEYRDLIKTHFHTHLANEHCLETFMVQGDATLIKKLLQKLQTSKKIDFVKLIVS
ncbi:CopG family ribbon-helix-helix protein [Candidatus Woesearchaeota archaeon]|nr:CopG family ribbon-helix-helix protein [Candidatus Woesearchaeota archaeon]